MRLIGYLLAILLAFPAAAAVADARTPAKLALVIGNGAYESLRSVPNGPGDAAIVAGALAEAGFRVLDAPNLSRDRLEQRLAEFRSLVAGAGPGAVALVYYAGHGFSLKDESLLLAVDARVRPGGLEPGGAIPLSMLLEAAAANPLGRGVVVVDACRDLVEFEDLGLAPGGLAPSARPRNTFLAFSTSKGYAAADGEAGHHSPFARAFVEEFRQAGQPLDQFFAGVKQNVEIATGHAQQPELHPSAEGGVILNEKPVSLARSFHYKAVEAFHAGDRKKSAELLLQAARLDDPVAMIAYADYLYYGTGVEPDIRQAIVWYHRAAQAGETNGWQALGQIHRDRAEIRDIQQAVNWFEEGVKAGNKESMYQLANILRDDKYGMKDVPRAIRLYEQSLEAYNCCSAVNLSLMYALGREVPRDLPRAKKLARLAADRGNVKGLENLGYIALQEGDYAESRRHYRLAASRGSAHGLLQLGVLAGNGWGVRRDSELAIDYFRRALVRARETGEAGTEETARRNLELLGAAEEL